MLKHAKSCRVQKSAPSVSGERLSCACYSDVSFGPTWQRVICCWCVVVENLYFKLLMNITSSQKTISANESQTFHHLISVDRKSQNMKTTATKGSQAKLQYFSKCPLGFLCCCLLLFQCFLEVFNLHSNVVPLFTLIYNADSEAISVKRVWFQDGEQQN